MRISKCERKTKETQIELKINLDGSGKFTGNTGIGFFDHMLDVFAKIGLLDLEVKVEGDIHIDGHHTVEDLGIVLGMAIKDALKDEISMVVSPSLVVEATDRLIILGAQESLKKIKGLNTFHQ